MAFGIWFNAATQNGRSQSPRSKHHDNHHRHVQSLPSTPKPQTTREVIQANVDLLIEQLEAGHSEALTAYLTAMGRFHNYSLGNILEIARHPGLYLKIDNEPLMELVIEAVYESGPCGFPALSVAHYGEQNGDAMRDPEMLSRLRQTEA